MVKGIISDNSVSREEAQKNELSHWIQLLFLRQPLFK